MKKKIKKYGKRYLVVVIVVMLSLFTLLSFYKDVTENMMQISSNTLDNNAEIFTLYVEDMFKERMDELGRIAKDINIAVQNDIVTTRSILKEKTGSFDALQILSANGRREMGDNILFQFSEDSSELEQIVEDGKSIIHQNIVKDVKQNRYIIMCAPIQYNGEVLAVLAGGIRANEISSMLEKWSYSQEGCAFIVTLRGDYVTEGEAFEEILGGEANNFFTYLSNCSMSKSEPDRSEIERSMQKLQNISVEYKYNGEKYVACLSPGSQGNWYIGYVQKASTMAKGAFEFSDKTILLGIVSGVLLLALVIAFLVSMYRNGENKEKLERYAVIDELDKALIFEFSFSPKELHIYGDTMSMIGEKFVPLYGEEVYEVYDKVHPDDASVRGRVHRFYDDDANIFSAEIRIKNGEGYGWFRIVGKLIKDPRFGTNQKFVGKIENADQEIAEEKNLVQRAENDLLTGVLNKKTMETKVVESIQKAKGNVHCIFFMVDLDNFKNVNDNLGHIAGDKAIVDTAERLSELFPNNAYVGRLGGDEFAVCAMYDAFDEESLIKYIKKKAEKICEVNRRTYSNGETSVSVSSSVGIAVAPEHATDFETLYKMADGELYKSKNGGKNCYHLHHA